MNVEVDQSIKIEQSGSTILAFANGSAHAIIIPSQVKAAGHELLRLKEKPLSTAHWMLFAAGLYLLLKGNLKKFKGIIIDIEYPGKNADIKASLLRHIWKTYPEFDQTIISFKGIGKKSPAHMKADLVRKKRDRVYRKITQKEFLSLLQ